MGGYTIMPRFRPCNYPADPEPNNSHEQASLLVNGTVQHGRLGYANGGEIDTEDWFRIETKNDSRAELTFYADTLLRLGWMEFFQLQADGELASLYTLDLDNYNKDTTFHISVDALGEGTYFLRMKQYAGHGGYRIKFNCVENPFSRHNTPNTTFATRTPIEVGKEAAGTIGYRSTTGRRTEAWYSIATGARADVSVSIKPDTTLSLSLGMCYLYRFEGYDEDGDPRLVHVAENRIERSEGSLTYVREQGDNAEYVLKIEHYDGCGGYTVTNGNSNATGATDVVISVGGRNTIRKGVPCENPVTLTNTAFHATKPFFVVFACTPEFSITGFKLQKEWGEEYVPIEEMGESDTTAVFLVPSLNPGERYTITMISEGRGDISYIKTRAVTASAIAVGIVSDLAADVAKDAICDYVIDAVANKVDLDKREAEQYASVMGLTVEQLGMEKQRTGVAAYTATSFFKAGVQKVTEKIPGGKILNTLGSVGEATANLSNSLRRRLWHWIYKETGLINDDKMGVSDGKMVASDVVSSWDPNEMVGPAGYGTAHFIGHTQTITYRILFENKAEAGAPAWRVRIFDELDPEVFNLETVRFGTTSHEGDAYQWETTREGGRLSWDIKGIELPPNVHAPEGEGWVEFSVDLKPGLPSGTQLKNKATIIFDKNTPIETNEYVNTLDLDAPASQMALEPYTPGANHLAFQLHATETGSGVSHYLLFVAEGEDGTFENCGPVWRSRLEFPIDPSQATTYQFFVVAVDNVGNAEQAQPKPITVHTATGINTILNTDAIKAIYGPDGTQRPHLQRGINIIHTKNGKARKVMLR